MKMQCLWAQNEKSDSQIQSEFNFMQKHFGKGMNPSLFSLAMG